VEVIRVPKRQVEVFTAGCPVCDPAVQLVQQLAGADDEVTVHDLSEEGAEAARAYGVKTVPAVVVEGRLAACCQTSGPDRTELEAAGVGQPFSG
jgi:glutaredoxin 3